ncbi:DUF5681 domain-containing protein [Hymenobacter sp. B1770]|uniref:DUF5681 domain-containing protein n=1 Tax=Hymenobacter sp. B1770 TaxID=1718788 RepID=UPI003CF1C8A3
MAFKKGISGNPNGRKPGTANKTTQTIRDKFAELLACYSLEQMKADLLAIESPKERLSILAGLAEFVTPKLSRTALSNDAETMPSVEDARAALLRRLIEQRAAE